MNIACNEKFDKITQGEWLLYDCIVSSISNNAIVTMERTKVEHIGDAVTVKSMYHCHVDLITDNAVIESMVDSEIVKLSKNAKVLRTVGKGCLFNTVCDNSKIDTACGCYIDTLCDSSTIGNALNVRIGSVSGDCRIMCFSDTTLYAFRDKERNRYALRAADGGIYLEWDENYGINIGRDRVYDYSDVIPVSALPDPLLRLCMVGYISIDSHGTMPTLWKRNM